MYVRYCFEKLMWSAILRWRRS